MCFALAAAAESCRYGPRAEPPPTCPCPFIDAASMTTLLLAYAVGGLIAGAAAVALARRHKSPGPARLFLLGVATAVNLFALVHDASRLTAATVGSAAGEASASRALYDVARCQSLLPQPPADPLIATLRAEKAALRKALGELSCRHTGVGPTGGFCLDNTTRTTGGNDVLSTALADKLFTVFSGRTVLDLGAGVGQYEQYWEELAAAAAAGTAGAGPKDVRAFDGAENVEEVTAGRVKWADLTEPGLDLAGGPADWVMSLEVAEHIPAEYEANFLRNLARHTRDGLVMSWALPGQPGHYHVNNRGPGYVVSTVEALGFVFNESASNETRAAADGPVAQYFMRNIYIFRRA